MDDRRTLVERLSGEQLAELDAKIRNCDSPSQIRDVMLQTKQPNGTFTREADGSITYGNSDFGIPSPAAHEAAPAPQEDDGMIRSTWLLPNGKLQVVEAYSQSGLGTLERSLERWGAQRVSKDFRNRISL